MHEVLSLAELIDFFNSVTENGMRTSRWLDALADGSITRSIEGQTFTVNYLGRRGYEVIFRDSAPI